MNILARIWAWIRGRKPKPIIAGRPYRAPRRLNPSQLQALLEPATGPILTAYDLSKPAKMLIPTFSTGEPLWGWKAEWRRRNREADRKLEAASRQFAEAVLDALANG